MPESKCTSAVASPRDSPRARDENARSDNILLSEFLPPSKPMRASLGEESSTAGDENSCCNVALGDDKKPPTATDACAGSPTNKADAPGALREVLTDRSNQKQLEPSLQAWAASRQGPRSVRNGLNVGASEKKRADTPPRAAAGRPTAADGGAGHGESHARVHSSDLQPAKSSSDPWLQSLREGSRSSSRGRAWQPHRTVPKGPFLRTASRSRSRSQASSVCNTPDSTPRRRRASESHGLSERHTGSARRTLSEPRRCQAAIEQHVERMASGRNPSASPLRRRLENSLPPMARTPVSQSPARSLLSEPRRVERVEPRVELSVDSRLSQLSCPRVLSRPHLSTDDQELRYAEEKRQEIRSMRLLNERKFKEAIENPDREINMPIRAPRSLLTAPRGPELSTARRGPRSRSSSRERGVIADCWELQQHMLPREQAAVENHLARAAKAAAAASGTCTPAASTPMLSRQGSQQGNLHGPEDDVDVDEWLQQAPNLGERARRARALAEANKDKVAASEWARLCIFRPVGAGEEAAKDPAPAAASERASAARPALRPEQIAELARAQAVAKCGEEVAHDAAKLCIFKQPGSASAPRAATEPQEAAALAPALEKDAADEATTYTVED